MRVPRVSLWPSSPLLAPRQRRVALHGLLCAAAAWGIAQLPLARAFEGWLQDEGFAVRPVRRPRARVAVIALDESFLNQLSKPIVYLSPEFARVIRYLKAQGAVAIGLDFLVPQNLSALEARAVDTAGGLGGEVVGRAVMDAGNVTLARRRQDDGGWLMPLDRWQFKFLSAPEPEDLGFVNLTEDPDYFVRSQQLLIREGDEVIQHFALALFARASGAPVRAEGTFLRVGDRRIPLDEAGRLRINYCGPPGTIPTVSFGDVLAAAEGRRPGPLDFHGVAAILGVTAASWGDAHATPFTQKTLFTADRDDAHLMAGPEIQASVYSTLADGAFLTRPVWLHPLLWTTILMPCVCLALRRMSLIAGLGLVVAVLTGWRALTLVAFTAWGHQLEVLPMSLALLLGYSLMAVVRWLSLRQLMGVVSAEPIARALERDPEGLRRGRAQEVTILFADIRGFTTFSETHSPEQVVALLNAYFSVIIPLIETHSGVVNQYMGDGIMVIFNAPDAVPEHARQAVRAAVALVRGVRDRSAQWTAMGLPDLRVGVGIHTGNAVAGLLGAPRRLTFSAIGDTTNTAARIEGLNKERGTEILISGTTWQQVRDAPTDPAVHIIREEEPARLRGRAAPLPLYSVRVDE